jgi:hypothetical protein
MDAEHILATAIERKVRITAFYNKGRVILAPHILYTRHDELYLDAVTVERDGSPPRETKLGTFKVQGLNDPRLDNYRFKPFAAFRRSDPKYAGATLVAV